MPSVKVASPKKLGLVSTMINRGYYLIAGWMLYRSHVITDFSVARNSKRIIYQKCLYYIIQQLYVTISINVYSRNSCLIKYRLPSISRVFVDARDRGEIRAKSVRECRDSDIIVFWLMFPQLFTYIYLLVKRNIASNGASYVWWIKMNDDEYHFSWKGYHRTKRKSKA